MRLFRRFRERLQISRLRKRARRSPSPATFGILAERLAALGQFDAAAKAADQGLRIFPTSERLAQVRLFAKKKRMTGRLRQLKQEVATRPTPLGYSRLAGVYRELGQDDNALEIAANCVERFPLNESPYLIQGEIRIARFMRDLVARDAVVAHEALGKATRLNTQNVRPHLMLAELYYVTGWISQCRRHLRAVLTVLPAARQVQTFLKQLEGAHSSDVEDGDFPEIARKVEAEGAFLNRPEDFPTLEQHRSTMGGRSGSEVDLSGLRTDIIELGDLAGVRNTLAVNRDASVIADYSADDGLDTADFAELVHAIRETSDDASRRMDAGALVRAEIDGRGGSIMIVRTRQLTIAVLHGDPLKAERVWEIVQDLLARNLTAASKELAHA